MATASLRIRQEGAAFCSAYEACGFEVQPPTRGDDLCRAVAVPFIPQESPELSEIPGLTKSTKAYFGEEVYPEIKRRIAGEDPSVLELGRATGRCIGALIEENWIKVDPPLRVLPQVVVVDSEQTPVTFSTGRVVEFGMGVNGLMSHVEQVRAARYTVAAISNRVGEVALLDGLASYFGIEGGIFNKKDGIGACLNDMLSSESPYAGGTDMMVVSRVWTKSSEFKQGLKKVAGLLRPGGVVVARGTADSVDGRIGYKAIGRILEKDPRLVVETKRTYQRNVTSRLSIEQHLTIARRPAS